jgi:hypothetical protein
MRLGPVLALAIALSAAPARAQDASCHVALSELTVDDQAPPDQYRDMLSEAIRPHIDPVLECYRASAVRDPRIQGILRLRLWVSARQVIRATPEESTLGDAELEQCATARIREFRLPPSAPEGGARVRFVLRFWREGAAAPGSTSSTTTSTSTTAPIAPAVIAPLPPPAFQTTVTAIRGGLSSTAVAVAIDTLALRPCQPGAGTAIVRLTIRPDGTARASAAGGTIRDRAALRCIRDAIQAGRMPAATTATRATATITFAPP